MKNKIISAMLVGMSATMAVPVTAVMAAEGEPAATEATAAEAAVTEEAPAEETPVEETQAEEAAPENEAEEVQEEEAVPQVDENGEVTEAAKDAATPADFREKLSTLSFSAEVFGKYADKLTAYATSDAVDKSNLYNCEMSVLDQAERYANGESGEAIKAIKYQIALEFEKVYGEDAFLPGRDIRKAILEDLGKAQDFTACTTIAEADQLYKDNEGIVTLPVDMIKKDDGDISVNPNPGEGENKPSTGGDGTGTGTEGETKPELDTYVSGIQDYEIKVGEDIDTSSISYNAEHISSVELDSSKVDNTTVGTYTISYIIKGIDGRVKTIDKQCVVIENSELTALRAEMCAKADVLFEGKFTEQAYAAEWKTALDDAKARINKLGTSDAEKMQGIVDELTKTGQDILDRQQLYIAQTGYVKILKEYYSSLKFETDSQKKMADETLNATVDKISKATSIDAASKALEDAKAALKDIAEQKETTLDELKEAAKAEINDKAKVINDSTSITSDIKNAFILKIDSCTDAKAIESAKNSADAAFTDVVAVVGGDMASFVNLFKDLKGISPDGDTTAMIDVVINLGAPKDMKDGANRVEDVCIALANSAEQFIKYLNVCAGQEVKGKTKAEKKLDALLTDNKFTDATYLEKAKEVVTKQKANLKQAANEATMQEVYKVAKENVEKLVTAQSTAANLAQVKANAIQSLQNGYPNPSSATTKILEKYINKINSATSETEVNDIVQECKDVLKKTGIDYNNNNGGGNNGGDSDVTPTPGAGIDSDVTPTPSNSATPNGGTTTTLPGGGSSTGTGTGSTGTGDASQKGTSDVSAAGNVKTGDENMGIIAMAGAAILAAIAAAGISLRKFLKKDE